MVDVAVEGMMVWEGVEAVGCFVVHESVVSLLVIGEMCCAVEVRVGQGA